jgi:hypothetical protein
MVRSASLLLALACAFGCSSNKSSDQAKFALDLVAASRTAEGIRADQVDADLVEKVRRSQLVRRMRLDTADPTKLLEALSGETGPDRQYPPAERPLRQRERATRGLKANAQGDCQATMDTAEAAVRIKFLTEPLDNVPQQVLDARAELAAALQSAEVIRLTCAASRLGVLAVRGADGKLRAVDLYEIGRGSIEINPNDPSMK